MALEFRRFVFNIKLVVVREFFSLENESGSEDDNVFSVVCDEDPGVTVGVTRVVNETGCVATNCGVNHMLLVHSEHVAATTLQHNKNMKTICKCARTLYLHIFD